MAAEPMVILGGLQDMRFGTMLVDCAWVAIDDEIPETTTPERAIDIAMAAWDATTGVALEFDCIVSMRPGAGDEPEWVETEEEHPDRLQAWRYLVST